MSDKDTIQGFWQIVSYVSGGTRIENYGVSHLQYFGNKCREIVPSLVDEGNVQCTFRLNEMTDPKRIDITMKFADAPSAPYKQRGIYELKGNRLKLCFGRDDVRPETFTRDLQLTTLKRHMGAPPEERKPSEMPPLEDKVLGRLVWKDNANWYSAEIEQGDAVVSVCLQRDAAGSLEASLDRARKVVRSLRKYTRLARKHAAERLLQVMNEHWLDEGEKPLTSAAFQKRMTLTSIVFDEEGGTTFYHDDGNLFLGHTIHVSLDAEDNCIDAHFSG